ncbi:MAG TPA: DUF2017 family protein [Actinomycetota bacterium]
MKPHIERTRRGYRLRLSEEERAVLRGLPGQMRAMLDSEDPSAYRLFPPGYQDDPRRAEEFRLLTRDDLVAHKKAAFQVLEETLDADRLDEDQLAAWMGALNDLRLVLGTRLGVTDEDEPDVDPDDPDAPVRSLYSFLGWLMEQAVDAAASGLGR